MKKTTPHWLAIGVLAVLLLSGIYKVVVVGNTGGLANDGRTKVMLTAAERQAVLAEMRHLLLASQGVIEALANDDKVAVNSAAGAVGSAAVSTMDFSLRAKLPLSFKKLGFATHQAFDEIADMATADAPAKLILLKLASTMKNCIACHESYQLSLRAMESEQRGRVVRDSRRWSGPPTPITLKVLCQVPARHCCFVQLIDSSSNS